MVRRLNLNSTHLQGGHLWAPVFLSVGGEKNGRPQVPPLQDFAIRRMGTVQREAQAALSGSQIRPPALPEVLTVCTTGTPGHQDPEFIPCGLASWCKHFETDGGSVT